MDCTGGAYNQSGVRNYSNHHLDVAVEVTGSPGPIAAAKAPVFSSVGNEKSPNEVEVQDRKETVLFNKRSELRLAEILMRQLARLQID